MFIQVYNNTPRAQQAANKITITDTQNNIYVPDACPTRRTSSPTGAAWCRPKAGCRCSTRSPPTVPTQGALLLYKIQIVSLDNRPLELKIVDPANAAQTASAELDV